MKRVDTAATLQRANTQAESIRVGNRIEVRFGAAKMKQTVVFDGSQPLKAWKAHAFREAGISGEFGWYHGEMIFVPGFGTEIFCFVIQERRLYYEGKTRTD